MIWQDHSRDPHHGDHAIFSPSNNSWVNDDTAADVENRYFSKLATTIGTLVHEEAYECIVTNTRYTKNEAKKAISKKLLINEIPRDAFDADYIAATFVNYVNDAIGFGLRPEQELYFSEWAYGTSDAIGFDEKKRILRVHDFKTGVTPAKFLQLELYSALFFLGDGKMYKPGECQIELRIYQGGEIKEEYPTAEDIVPLMDSYIWHTKIMDGLKEG